jgi:hypothetical protein
MSGAPAKKAEKSEEDRPREVREVCRKLLKDGPVDEWTAAKVAQFLDACSTQSLLGSSQGGVSLADIFRKHGVRGRQLVLLDGISGNQKLKEPPFNIVSLGQRLKLLDAVKVLIEEDVEARTHSSAPPPGALAESDGKPHGRADYGRGGLAEMLGRTCPRAASRRGAPEKSELVATVPAWQSTAFPPTGWVDPGEAGRTVPPTKLELEFVFGYSGSRARGNLCCNVSGEIIFPASYIAVVFNIETRTQRFFLEHTDEVSAIAMHPEKVIVATGEHGLKGKVCVWDSHSMETLAVLPRSVVSSAEGEETWSGVSCLSFADNYLTTKGESGDLVVAVTEDMMVSIHLTPPVLLFFFLCRVSAPPGFLPCACRAAPCLSSIIFPSLRISNVQKNTLHASEPHIKHTQRPGCKVTRRLDLGAGMAMERGAIDCVCKCGHRSRLRGACKPFPESTQLYPRHGRDAISAVR